MDWTLTRLQPWIRRQRWYAGKAGSTDLTLLADLPVPGVPGAHVLLVRDSASAPAVRYAIPVRWVDTVSIDSGDVVDTDGGRALIDATRDHATMAALIELACGSVDSAAWSVTGITAQRITGDVAPLDGEQSNTSVIASCQAGPVIAKLFRRLEEGVNPDIELQGALTLHGCQRVPRTLGSLSGSWTEDGQAHAGSVLFVQEFLPGTEDAWRVALRDAATGSPFAAPASALGAAVAEVHAGLAAALPTRPATDDDRTALTGAWRRRLTIACAEIPQVARFAPAIEAVYSDAASRAWPDLQRVHGDLHLGQVLFAGDRGWIVLDFEGEPMRPVSERRSPDLAFRDVAGMLRSFDYAAGAVVMGGGEGDPDATWEWARQAREAFCAGYTDAGGTAVDPRDPLPRALELDKAVYEAVYEARNRPDWLAIPLAAIEHLTR